MLGELGRDDYVEGCLLVKARQAWLKTSSGHEINSRVACKPGLVCVCTRTRAAVKPSPVDYVVLYNREQ